MKKIFLLFLMINFTACNQEKIEVEIFNKSNSIISDIKFNTANDSIVIEKLNQNQQISKTLKFSFDQDKIHPYYAISFKRNNGQEDGTRCTDILDDGKKRYLKIFISDDKIETEYNGECY